MGHCLVREPFLVNMEEDCGSVWEPLSCGSAAGAGLLLSPSKVPYVWWCYFWSCHVTVTVIPAVWVMQHELEHQVPCPHSCCSSKIFKDHLWGLFWCSSTTTEVHHTNMAILQLTSVSPRSSYLFFGFWVWCSSLWIQVHVTSEVRETDCLIL